jgi:hypothetical protein
MKVFNHYAYDEKNTLHQKRMLINVGGGSTTTGLVTGIHWHMNIANEITYISTDDHRQVIPWVKIKDRHGNVTEYYDRNRPLSLQQIATSGKRRMDCVDCHNRPAHVYLPPDVAVDQAFVGGCSGGMYQNILNMTEIQKDASLGSDVFNLSVYPASQPMMLKLAENGALAKLMSAGAVIRSAFCGPCFGAGDTPGNGGFSIRHSTRNFPNREGSKPSDGQISYVALMDARSIAATALNGGVLTAATELDNPPVDTVQTDYTFNPAPYNHRVYFGNGKPDPSSELVFGPISQTGLNRSRCLIIF